MRQIEAREFDAYISSLTMAEIIWIIYRESGSKTAKEIQSYLRELSELRIIKVVPLDDNLVYDVLNLIEKYKFSFVDALVVATAVSLNSTLVTRDDEIKKVRAIKVKVPDELV